MSDRDVVYSVGLDDQTAAVLDKINSKIAALNTSAASLGDRASLAIFNAKMELLKQQSQKNFDAAADSSARLLTPKENGGPLKAFNDLPQGFAKMETESAGSMSRINMGMNRTFGGMANILSGNFRAGMMEINHGVAQMLGRSTESLNAMAVKAAGIGAAFAGGFTIGTAIDELFGISDKIAKNFEATLDPITEYRDKMREISAMNLSNLVKEFQAVGEAAKKATEDANITRDTKVAQARQAGNSGAEWMAEQENIKARKSQSQGAINKAEDRKRQLIKNFEDAKSNFNSITEQGGTTGDIEQARATMQSAARDRRQAAPVLDQVIEENRTALRKINVEKINSETSADKTIKENREATLKKEEKEKVKIDAIFERRDKEVATNKKLFEDENHAQVVHDMEVADKKDAAIIAKSKDDKIKAKKDIDKADEWLDAGPREHREMRRTERDKAREDKRNDHREKLALKDFEREFARDPLLQHMTRRQREVYNKLDAERQLGIANVNERTAKQAIEDREKQRLQMELDAQVDRRLTITELKKHTELLTVGA